MLTALNLNLIVSCQLLKYISKDVSILAVFIIKCKSVLHQSAYDINQLKREWMRLKPIKKRMNDFM